MKKATPKNEAAQVVTEKLTKKKSLCPRQLRVLCRLQKGEVTVRELFGVAGNNPAETVRQLRGLGLVIGLEWVNGTDYDGKKIRYGKYSINAASLELAKSLIGG